MQTILVLKGVYIYIYIYIYKGVYALKSFE